MRSSIGGEMMKCEICKNEAKYILEGKLYCYGCFLDEVVKNGDVKVKNVNITVYEYGDEEYWESPEYSFDNGLDDLLVELETDYEVEFVE